MGIGVLRLARKDGALAQDDSGLAVIGVAARGYSVSPSGIESLAERYPLQFTQIAIKQKPDWSKRVARADELAKSCPWAGETLGFYRHVLEFQGETYQKLSRESAPAISAQQPLRTVLDFGAAAQSFPAMVAVARRHGPAAMATAAAEFASVSVAEAERLLRAFAGGETIQPVEQFLALAVLQPYAERLSADSATTNADSGRGLCPACDGKPLVSVLRPEGDGGKRWLLCSFCLLEWEFRRILCPYCGEEDNSKLPLFQPAGDVSAVSLQACLTCRRYLKAVDTTVDGHAVPLVDEIASSPLDVWASGQGYQKLQLNILGF